MKADWVKTHLENPRPGQPFSFVYGGKASRELLPSWTTQRGTATIDAHRTSRTLSWSDPATGLWKSRCVAVEYADFPAVEWTVYFKNTGKHDTPILEQIQGLDVTLERGLDAAQGVRPALLEGRHLRGGPVSAACSGRWVPAPSSGSRRWAAGGATERSPTTIS